jgi:hypothetical protein
MLLGFCRGSRRPYRQPNPSTSAAGCLPESLTSPCNAPTLAPLYRFNCSDPPRSSHAPHSIRPPRSMTASRVRLPPLPLRRPDHARDGTPRPSSVATTTPGDITLSCPFLDIKVTGTGDERQSECRLRRLPRGSVDRHGHPTAPTTSSSQARLPPSTPSPRPQQTKRTEALPPALWDESFHAVQLLSPPAAVARATRRSTTTTARPGTKAANVPPPPWMDSSTSDGAQ